MCKAVLCILVKFTMFTLTQLVYQILHRLMYQVETHIVANAQDVHKFHP